MATDAMKDWLLSIGIGGSALAALCCFTPFLPWLLAILGFSSALGYFYNDVVLLLALALFLSVTGYAIWRRNQNK